MKASRMRIFGCVLAIVLVGFAPRPARAVLLGGDVLDQIHDALNQMAKTVSVLYDHNGNPVSVTNGLLGVSDGAQRYQWLNVGMPATIGPHAVARGLNPIDLRSFSAAAIHFTWPAADSDSVVVEIFTKGKLSPNAADGFDYSFFPDTSTIGPKGFVIVSNPLYLGNADLAGRRIYCTKPRSPGNPGTLPAGAMGVETNGIVIPLADIFGSAVRFGYLTFDVYNRAGGKTLGATDLQVLAKGN